MIKEKFRCVAVEKKLINNKVVERAKFDQLTSLSNPHLAGLNSNTFWIEVKQQDIGKLMPGRDYMISIDTETQQQRGGQGSKRGTDPR